MLCVSRSAPLSGLTTMLVNRQHKGSSFLCVPTESVLCNTIYYHQRNFILLIETNLYVPNHEIESHTPHKEGDFRRIKP